MFSCTIIVMSCVSLFPIKKDGIIWATFVLTARPPCGRRGQAVTNSRNCLISQFLSETQRKVVFHGQLFLLQVQLAIRMSKRAFQRSKDVQRCPKPSSLTIFFQVSCGQAPAKQVAQSKNIYTAQTTCTGSHKRIQQSNRNGLKKQLSIHTDQLWRPQLIGGDFPWRQTKVAAESCLPWSATLPRAIPCWNPRGTSGAASNPVVDSWICFKFAGPVAILCVSWWYTGFYWYTTRFP